MIHNYLVGRNKISGHILDKGVMIGSTIGTLSIYHENTFMNSVDIVVDGLTLYAIEDPVEEDTKTGEENKSPILNIIGFVLIVCSGLLFYYKYNNTNHYRRFKKRKNLIDYRYK